LKKLAQLTLDNNPLREFPDSIGELTNLSVLNFKHNNIEALPESFQKLTQLPNLIIILDDYKPSMLKSIRNFIFRFFIETFNKPTHDNGTK